MPEEVTIQKTLVEQIFDEMFATIEQYKEFDTQAILKLKQLAISGDLTKAMRVAEAIKLASEVTL